jgi:predicted ATP-grasp superfamily ATP-dependent carboligase
VAARRGGEIGAPPRILVTDAQDRPALAAIRSLHAAGYRVSATANTRVAPGLWSRGCCGRAILPDPGAGVDDFIARLDDVLRRDRPDVLVPGTDETLYAVSLRRDRLMSGVTIGLPGHRIVERALDKSCLATEAERVGLATPEGRVCEGRPAALAAAREFGFPVLVKGVRTIAEAGGRLTRYPTRLVDGESELGMALGQFGTCIVQRRETGDLISFAGVATERGLLASVVSRYHRTWPPVAGQASFLETITPPLDLRERVRALVAAIGWTGLFQLQLIEGAGGIANAIDFNPRLYGSMSIADAAGAPLAALWCAWLLGEDPRPATARPGFRYRMEDMDARHIAWQLRRGDYRRAGRALLPARRTTHAYFQARDPAPLLVRAAELAAARWQHSRGQ